MIPYKTESKTVDGYWISSRYLRNIVSKGPLRPLVQKPHGYELSDCRWSPMSISDQFGNKTEVSAWINYTSDDYAKLTFSSSDEARLIIKHRNRIGEKSLNLLDTLRTRKETVNMVTSNVMKMVKALRLLKRGKWRKAANALGVTPKGAPKSQNVPQRWLELQYGWLPLLSDIYAAGNKLFRDPVYSVTTRARLQDKSGYQGSEYRVGHYFKSVHYRERETKVSVSTWFRIKSAAVTTLDNLGVLNPALVAWEAVPWSFVVDWLLPVGDFLESLTALSGVEIISSSQTKKFVVKTDYTTTTRGYTKTSGSGKIHNVIKTRVTPYSISVVLPRFENPLSLTHFANAMSLLATSFRSK